MRLSIEPSEQLANGWVSSNPRAADLISPQIVLEQLNDLDHGVLLCASTETGERTEQESRDAEELQPFTMAGTPTGTHGRGGRPDHLSARGGCVVWRPCAVCSG